MFEKLEQIRQKSDHQKRMIALGTSFGITFVIFVFWFVSLTVSLSSGDDSAAGSGVASSNVSPLSAMTANISDAFAPVENSFSNLVSYFSSGPATSSASAAVTK